MPTNSLGKSSELKLHCFCLFDAYSMPKDMCSEQVQKVFCLKKTKLFLWPHKFPHDNMSIFFRVIPKFEVDVWRDRIALLVCRVLDISCGLRSFSFWIEKIGEKVHTRNCRYIKHLINDKKVSFMFYLIFRMKLFILTYTQRYIDRTNFWIPIPNFVFSILFFTVAKNIMDLLLLIFSFRLVLPSIWSIFCRHFLTCL